jgi:calcineurin-like phosphoesterase family protein
VIWFTSDLHFFHKNVIGFCNRPWTSVEEMNEGLIKNWNDRVRKTEQVYVLGDFLFGGSSRLREIVPRLNGQKTLVRGNHDATARKVIAAGFHDVVENEAIKLPNGTKVLLSRAPGRPRPASSWIRVICTNASYVMTTTGGCCMGMCTRSGRSWTSRSTSVWMCGTGAQFRMKQFKQ